MLVCPQAIFQAHGPAFKSDYRPEAFDNIHLYNLMCGECACGTILHCSYVSTHCRLVVYTNGGKELRKLQYMYVYDEIPYLRV